MKQNEIEGRLKRAIDEAPIDLLEKLESMPVVKMIAHDEITAQEIEPKSNSWGRFRPMMAAAVLLLAVGVSWMWTQAEIAKIYLDINPALSLSVNRMEKVKEVVAYNEEAKNLIDGLKLKGLKKDEALTLLYERLPKDQRSILLSVESGSEKVVARETEESVAALRNLQAGDNNSLVLTQRISPSETMLEGANKMQITPGKLELIKKMILAGSKKETEVLAKYSVSDLVRNAYEEGIEIADLVEVYGSTESYKPVPKPVPVPIVLPKTEPPATEPPTTEAPKTETPRTEAPRTESPATQAPVYYDDDDDDDDDDDWEEDDD